MANLAWPPLNHCPSHGWSVSILARSPGSKVCYPAHLKPPILNYHLLLPLKLVKKALLRPPHRRISLHLKKSLVRF